MSHTLTRTRRQNFRFTNQLAQNMMGLMCIVGGANIELPIPLYPMSAVPDSIADGMILLVKFNEQYA